MFLLLDFSVSANVDRIETQAQHTLCATPIPVKRGMAFSPFLAAFLHLVRINLYWTRTAEHAQGELHRDEHLRPSTARRTQKVRTYCTARPCSVWRACSCSIPLCSNLASAALTILVFKESRCLPGGPPTLSRSGRWCYPRLEGGRTLFGSSLPTYVPR